MDERNLTKEKRLAFLMPDLSRKPGHHVVVVDQTGRERPWLAAPGKSVKPIWYRRASSFVAYAVPAGQNLRHQFSRPWQTGDQRHSLVLHYRLEFRIQDPVLLVERLASDPLKQLEDEVDALVAGRVKRLAWEVIVHKGDDLVPHLLPKGRIETSDRPSLCDSLQDFAADLGLDVMNIGVTRTLPEIEPEVREGVEGKKRIVMGLEHETALYKGRLQGEIEVEAEKRRIAGAKGAAVRSWVVASGEQGKRVIERLVDNINGPDDLGKAIKAVVGGARILEGSEPISQKQVTGSNPWVLLSDGEVPRGPLAELLAELSKEFTKLPCESSEGKNLLSAALHLVGEAIRGNEAESKVLLRYKEILDQGFRRNVDDLVETQESLFKRLRNIEALQRELS